MKRIPMLIAVVAGALALSGCLQLHSDTVIDKDGSGTATITMSVSTEVADALKELKAMDAGQSEDMDFAMFDEINRDEIEAAGKDHGVKVEKFEKKEADGRQTLNVVLAFNDLEGLSYVMGDIMGGGNGEGYGIFDAGDGNLVLRSTTYDFPEEVVEEVEKIEKDEPPAEADPEQMQKQMALMGTLMGSLSELDVSMKFTVPGDIVKSNAPTVEGRTSIWTINQSNMMEANEDMEPEIVFSGKGLKIKPLKE